MVKHLIVLFCTVFALGAANVYIFNPASTPVANRGQAYRTSVNTTDFEGLPGVLINPTIPNVPIQWTVADGGSVRAMTATESNNVLAAEAAAETAATAAAEAAAKSSSSNVLERLDEQARLFRALVRVITDTHNRTATNMIPALPTLTYEQVKTRVLADIANQPNSQ